MTRLSTLMILAIALGLAGCPTGGGDDDDSGVADDDDATGDDDDDATGDDDDSTPLNEEQESEPNDEHPFQDFGNLPAGRTTIAGTLSTAGHEPTGAQWFTGDIDGFTFRVGTDQTISVSLNWGTAGDDLDVVLFASLDENDELTWNSPQAVAEGASQDRPESFNAPLSANVAYTAVVGNWEGDANASYLLTIDVPE